MQFRVFVPIDQNTIFLMFLNRLRLKLSFAIVALHEALIPELLGCSFIKVLNLLVGP